MMAGPSQRRPSWLIILHQRRSSRHTVKSGDFVRQESIIYRATEKAFQAGSHRQLTDDVDVQSLLVRLRRWRKETTAGDSDRRQRTVADEESITVDDDAFQVGRRMARSSPRREGIRRRVSIDYIIIGTLWTTSTSLQSWPASAVIREDEGSWLWAAYTIGRPMAQPDRV